MKESVRTEDSKDKAEKDSGDDGSDSHRRILSRPFLKTNDEFHRTGGQDHLVGQFKLRHFIA